MRDIDIEKDILNGKIRVALSALKNPACNSTETHHSPTNLFPEDTQENTTIVHRPPPPPPGGGMAMLPLHPKQ